MISFGAKYIGSAIAERIDRNTQTKTPFEVSFIELDAANPDDVNTVSVASKEWGFPEYAEVISDSMQRTLKCGNDFKRGGKYYAITSQKKYFATANPEEILALCRLTLSDKISIDYLQVKPERLKSDFEFNHIGSSMLDSIKKFFSGRDIKTFSTPNAKPFYFANGFEENKDCETEMYYEA